MGDLFFWIIVVAFLVPVALRLYRKSVRGNQDKGVTGGFPDRPGAGYPGQEKQPRDGYTQQDYFRGGFGPAAGERPAPPQYPGFPSPGQPGDQAPGPYGDSPGHQGWPPASGQTPAGPPAGPAVPPPVPPVPSGPQGYRARRLAELDQRYSDGELNLEDYLAQREEIMKG